MKPKAKRTITPAQYRAMESEASVEARVTVWLEERGYRVHPLVTEVERGYRGKSRRNPANTPDLIAVLIHGTSQWWSSIINYPRVMYLELKRAKGGRHSAGQLAMADKLRDEGFAVFQHQSNGVDVITQLEEWLRQ